MKNKERKNQEPFVMVEPLAIEMAEETSQSEEGENPVLKLQLVMATNSINHEYARMEYEDTFDKDRQDELLEYMGSCRQQYLEARQNLSNYDPHSLNDFEADLLQQKMKTLNRFNA